MTVALTLFGVPTIVYGGRSVALGFERRTQLLVYLAMKRTWIGRAEVAALLWPDQDSKLAYTNLRKALFRLQRFPWAEHIEAQGNALRFEVDTDVQAFEVALREHRTTDALPLFRGTLLSGFDDGSNEAWSGWLSFERDRLQSAWRSAAQQRLAGDIDAAEATDLAVRLLDADPLDEAALQAYMTWLARAGQLARARQAYREFVARLADELGLEPGAGLKALHDSLGTATSAGAAVPLASSPTDDRFVGRTVELRRAASLLAQDDCRLLTITGPGGVGKTRLAQRVLRECAPMFADGATFVALDDLTGADELGARLARELDIELKGPADPFDQVIEALRTRQTLLLLDNFEQLIDAAPDIGRLLVSCPRVKAIATSRLRLALQAEWLLPLGGLPCPEDEDRDVIESFDAVLLFVNAARRVQPELAPMSEAAAIVDICRQVDGLPLALELAAAWTRVLSCEAIAQELRRGSELLHATDGTQPTRHASFEVVFEQSWRLLTEVEREALARLSVFHGSFSPDAARAVAGSPLAVLGSLADKSLLSKDGARLRLHPLVQQLAATRLVALPTEADTEAAHAEYFHRMLGQMAHTVTLGDRSALEYIDHEFENVRRAWQWSIAQGSIAGLSLSHRALLEYCDHRGRFEEGLALLRMAAQSSAVQQDAELHALLLSKVSHLEYRLDRYAEAESTAARALAATRRGRDRGARVQALNVLGTCAFRLGRLADARRYFKLALASVSPEWQANSTASTIDHLALIEKNLGHYDESLRLALQSLAQYRLLGDRAEEALCLNNLGSLQLLTGDEASAGAHLREGLAICESDGLHATRAFILTNLVELAMRAGNLDGAVAYAERAIQVSTATGNRAVTAWAQIKAARVLTRRAELGRARAMLADAVAKVMAVGLPSLKIDSLAMLAELLAAQGEQDCARAVLDFTVTHPATTPAARKEALIHLSGVSASDRKAPPWSGLELDDVLQRIVAEHELAYAPLIASLGGAR
jgi:predicted ATPase/DNA-binding SARP family transcriptional activator